MIRDEQSMSSIIPITMKNGGGTEVAAGELGVDESLFVNSVLEEDHEKKRL